jgi:hypothetical protein
MKRVKWLQGRANIKWIRAWLECLVEEREVVLFKTERHQLQLFLGE